MANTITYGEHVIDIDALPPASVAAMLRRGISHYLGNEVASKVAAWVNKQEETERKTNPDYEVDENAKFAQKNLFQGAALDALLAGEVGNASRGPRVDPLQAEINKLLKAEVTTRLATHGIKPAGKKRAWTADDLVKFADGREKTIAAMCQTLMDKDGDKYTKEAQKILAEVARREKRAKESAAEAKDATAEALGL